MNELGDLRPSQLIYTFGVGAILDLPNTSALILGLDDWDTRAVARGIQLTLIVESEDESEGQLTRDAIAAFKDVPATGTHIYYWPIQKRERNQAGRPGKLHAKCAIIDDVALIGSANLTDDAFNRNMELGILVREPATVFAVAEHFQELIRAGSLAKLVPGSRK
jgi:phosphatidylserine/phosphatidylglycerophosphate/cardiolipin synthase-like enzyme